MTSELSGLLERARHGELSALVRPGECLEVHSADGGVAVLGIKSLRRFVRDWAHCAAWLWADNMPSADPAGRWLGVVHEAGAMLLRLPAGR